VRLVRTDIAGFVGFAERGPLVDPSETDPGIRVQAAVKVNSWNDFRLQFGGFLPYSYLAYAVRGFFATGGETCYVARVGVSSTPPTAALMPLPAAITSTVLANLALAAPAGATELRLDAPVTLSIGASIAIGDPAFTQQLVVTAVSGQNITVSDATQRGAGLIVTQPAGSPVFALAGPAVASQITSVATANTAGATQIQLGSSYVTGMLQGALIAIGDPVTGECVSVQSIVDDQTITVQPPLLTIHAVGEPVYSITGSSLTAMAAVGATSVQVADTSQFAQHDLIIIEGSGVTEVRVVTEPPAGSTLQLGLALGFAYLSGAVVRRYNAALTVNAMSAGAWGNGIQLEITPLDPGHAVTHFSLRVTVDQGADPAQPPQEEFYPLLSLDPYDPYPQSGDSGATMSAQVSSIYAPNVVNPVSELIQMAPALPATLVQGTRLLVGSAPLHSGFLYLEGGSDGTPLNPSPAPAAPGPNPCSRRAATVTTLPASQPYPSPPNASTQDFLDALSVLCLVDEISILCCPDAAGPPPETPLSGGWSMSEIQQAMVSQCVRLQYRVAVLDTPRFQAGQVTPLQPAGALKWLSGQAYSDPAARYAAVYYPWLQVPDELGIEGPNRTVPPCGHVAGAYAYTDNTYGVQKPPANVELQFASDVQVAVSNQQQGLLNTAGINAIRYFPGRGIRVWGARSISTSRSWTYIHTRRLMSMIEDSVEQASQWVVFQTNDDNLRRMLTHSLNVFLRSIWLAGGLKGSVPADGYYVKCDSTNNTPATIDAGQLICQVGVAVAAPIEFLVFEMRLSVAGALVVEA
jgi:hypothetical protein